MRPAALVVVLATLVACASSEPERPPARQALYCAPGTTPCGTGCRPTGTVCCDDGTGKTSSYCDGNAGCFVNGARGCQAGKSGTPSAFCCGANGTTGSEDCPPGQHHCGAACVPLDEPCCTGSGCPSTTVAPAGTCDTNVVLCGMCRAENVCRACPSGSCCSGDVCSNTCVTGDACVVPTTPKTGCNASADCGDGKVCVSSRRCQLSTGGDGCTCTGDLAGTCVDFSQRTLSVSACGTCTNEYSACCPGTLCIDGQCKATCP